MAWINLHFYSRVLGLSSELNVILPEPDEGLGVSDSVWDGETTLPVLYLLHGMSDDHTIWLRRTSIDRYAAGRKLAIVMPAAHRSYYSNQVYGLDYLKYIGEEVPEVCRRFFKISNLRDENFIAGLSMGGYGAMRVGLNYVEKFSHIASMSGILDISNLPTFERNNLIGNKDELAKLKNDDSYSYRRIRDFKLCFGDVDEFLSSNNNLLNLIESHVANKVKIPKLHISIGLEDYLYPTNTSFVKRLKELKVPFEYLELSGIHEWAFWDSRIQDILDWLPIEKEKPIGNSGAEAIKKFQTSLKNKNEEESK